MAAEEDQSNNQNDKKPVGKCECLCRFLESLGKFGLGLAAVLGVIFAPATVKQIYELSQNQSQAQTQTQQTTIIVPSKAVKDDYERVMLKVKTDKPKTVIEAIPKEPAYRDGSLQGVFILPAYREAALEDLEKSANVEQKQEIINDYFKKSIQASDGQLNLKLNH